MIFFWRKKPVPFHSLGLNREMHCHILPGVDDGVSSSEDALSILGGMSQAGIGKVTFTPHMNPDVYPESNEEFLVRKYEGFMKKYGNQSPVSSLDVNLGAEYMVTADFHHRDASELLQFESGKALIEMSYYYPSLHIEDAIFNLVSNGITPVLAHPERYLYLAENLRCFERLQDMGCQFQMNVLSLSGAYGSGSVRILNYLLKNDYYSYIGFDTHSPAHLNKVLNLPVRYAYLPYLEKLIDGQNVR